jgi:hypothetical protein
MRQATELRQAADSEGFRPKKKKDRAAMPARSEFREEKRP